MNQKTALIVDDNAIEAHLISLRLKDLDYKCQIAISGCEGIEYLKLHSVDVITMDIMMPIMDGIETIRFMRKFCDTPIIIITNIDRLLDDDEIKEFVNQHGIEVITKPIIYSDVAGAIKRQAAKK